MRVPTKASISRQHCG